MAAMAVGIGANTAVFSVAHAVLLKSLPYADPDRLVFITEVQSGTSNSVNVPPANYLDYSTATALESAGAAEAWGATLTGSGAPEQVRGLRLTASMFRVLGVAPMLGRTFAASEDRVVVLTYPYWARRFGGDASAVGSTVMLNGEPWRIAGVMPRDFRFAPFWATNAQMFAPLVFDEAARASRGRRSLRVFGRLAPGATAERAKAELAAIFARPGAPENARLEPAVTRLHERVAGKARTPLMVLLYAVGLVLLIACANVATLLLVRTMDRRREFAVRLSLGATRGRLLRDAFIETALLCVAGGAAGVLLASLGIDALSAWFRSSMPRYEEIAISTPVLVFTAAVSLATALVLSIAPAFQISFLHVQDGLREGARTAGDGAWALRMRRGLVMAQVALSFVLLLGAGLLLRSLAAVQSVDPGFRARDVLSAVVHTWGTPVAERRAQMAFYRTLLDRMSGLPGVERAALINHLPLAGDMWGMTVDPEGHPAAAPGEQVNAVYRVASRGYFQAMQIPVLRGRVFEASDVFGAQPVAVVNDAMAKQVWPGENAVGKRFRIRGGDTVLTVAGVVANVVQQDWVAERKPEFYIALEQNPDAIGRAHTSAMMLVLRGAAALRGVLAGEVAQVNATVPVTDVQTLADVVADATRRPRVFASLLGVFAAGAVLLAAIGVYGLVAYDARRRTREVGVRIALGARPADVMALVLLRAMKIVAAGTAAGLVGAVAASRMIEAMLYGVPARDLATFAVVVVVFAVVAFAAAFVPARRAARMDAAIALRSE
jgi:putative ABC transport system permease protein